MHAFIIASTQNLEYAKMKIKYLFNNSNSTNNTNNVNFFGSNPKNSKQTTKPFHIAFDKGNTNKYFSVERQSTEHTNY